jgi:flagellar biosynthesis protein FlhG
MGTKRIIAVGGGKGGVGKSFIAVNLGATLAQQGKQVVMLDADFGGANLHSLFGIVRPDKTVHDFIDGRVDTLGEVSIATSVPRLSIVSGTCEVLGSAELGGDKRRRLLSGLDQLDADCLLIDVGAGTSIPTIDLFNSADVRLVVMTPEMTSAQNAYGFLKVALYRRLQRALEGHPAEQRLKDSVGDNAFEMGSAMEKVDSFMTIVGAAELGLDGAFRMLLREFNAKLVGNMLSKESDRNVLFALRRVISNFLSLNVDVAAAFRTSTRVRDSINRGKPLAASNQADFEAAEFQRLGRGLLEQDLGPLEELRKAITDALSQNGSNFAFGLDGVEVIEIEEITDLEELAEIESAAADEVEQQMLAQGGGDGARRASPDYEVEMSPAPPEASSEAVTQQSVKGTTSQPPAASPPATVLDQPTTRDSAPPGERAMGTNTGKFANALGRARRRKDRGTVHVQVHLIGHWFMGELLHINAERAIVTGIHPVFAQRGTECTFRLVTLQEQEEKYLPPPATVIFDAYDQVSGQTVLRFPDATQAEPLLDYARTKACGVTG